MKWTTIGVLFFHAFVCFLFIKYTDGLLYVDPYGDLIFTDDLSSSGSDDNSFAFFIGISSLFIGIIAFFFKPSKLNFLALSISALTLELICVLLIQAGNIFQTIWYSGNVLLILVVMIPPILLVINAFANRIRLKEE